MARSLRRPPNRERARDIRAAAISAGGTASARLPELIVDEGIVPVTSTRHVARLRQNLRGLAGPRRQMPDAK